ncbi:MAG: VCBS repeat-containing protein, partial [Thermoplasmata archaeon]|nr:VCBS repeat-containing protein [Thermoplasmata archaeon]
QGTGSELIVYLNDRTGFNFIKQEVADPEKTVGCVGADDLNEDVLAEVVYCTESNSSKELGLMSYTGSLWKNMGTFGDGSDVRTARIADLNNDGINDVVFATSKLQVLLALNPAFAYTWYNYSLATSVYSLLTCDFDNDGFTDVVLGCENGSVYAFENKRNGSFTARYLGNAGTAKLWDMEAFDYDRDGDLDIVVASDDRNLYILNNTLLHRNFDLYLNSEIPLSDDRPIAAIATADLDNDGDTDIVTAHTGEFSACIYAWKNPGDAMSSPFNTSWERYTVSSDFLRVYSLACGDVDNDGYPEIVFSGHNGSKNMLCVAASNKNPWGPWVWDWEEWYDFGNTIPVGKITQIALADMNRDGTLDVVSGDTDGWLIVFKRGTDSITDHDGDWLDATARIQNNTVLAVETGDLDRDGWVDIACGYESNPGVKAGIIWRNLQNPFNISGWQQYFFDGVDINITTISLADFNRDGYLDIATVVNGSQGAKIWRNPRNLTDLWNAYDVSGFTNIASLAAADMNNNGWCDLVLGIKNGIVAYVEKGGVFYTYYDTAHSPLSVVNLANLDRKSNYDGNDLDVLVGAGNSCYIYKNRGSNAKIDCIKLMSSSLIPGETRALMLLNVTHNGVVGDNGFYFSRVSVQFLNANESRVMAPGEMNDLFENVSVWLDADGNAGFNNATDRWLAGTSDFGTMYRGFLKITLMKTAHTSVLPEQTKGFFITVKVKNSIPSNYSGYKLNISVWPDDPSWESWNAIYDSVTYGIATIMETAPYYSSVYTVYIVPEGIATLTLTLFLLVGLNAVHYRKLRRKAF